MKPEVTLTTDDDDDACIPDGCRAQDNSKFASCGRDKDVFMWDVPTAQVIRKFEGHKHVPRDMTLWLDGKLVEWNRRRS